MLRTWLGFLSLALTLAPSAGAAAGTGQPPKHVVIIPLKTGIAEPALYILRRGLKEAIAEHADVVVLDIKTPGGALDVTFSMMEALEKFHGTKIAFVDDEAMSAGAFISATADEIWFAPEGVIGAAAPVTSTGQDVDATMKLKITSYLEARMRAISEGKRYRGQVISAMIDPDTELKIDGQVLKEKGKLLSLTATEAMNPYGQPPRPLLGAGIARDTADLLAQKYGSGRTEVTQLEATWSERLAVFLNGLAPVLLGLGILALFIEFKTPGFGVFGISGIGLLAIVFLSSSVAGLSGHEPLALFAVGVVLLVLELVFFHSAGFLGVIGFALIVGSLAWAMADLWPNEPLAIAWSADAFVRPMVNLGLGFAIAIVLAALVVRFLPHGWFLDRLVVGATVGGAAQTGGSAPGSGVTLDALIGMRGVAATALRPAGQVEVGGRRYEAKIAVGDVAAGAPVVVRGRMDFGLIVERAD